MYANSWINAIYLKIRKVALYIGVVRLKHDLNNCNDLQIVTNI